MSNLDLVELLKAEDIVLALQQVINSSSDDLTINCSQVDYISSKNLQILISLYKSINNMAKKIKFLNVSQELVDCSKNIGAEFIFE